MLHRHIEGERIMSEKKLIVFDSRVRPVHSHLDPIVDLLIQHGNLLARDFRWGENRTGFYCFLQHPLDFDLIEKYFEIPSFIRFDHQNDAIECDYSWATIKGGMEIKRLVSD